MPYYRELAEESAKLEERQLDGGIRTWSNYDSGLWTLNRYFKQVLRQRSIWRKWNIQEFISSCKGFTIPFGLELAG